jgi:RimJ/RimL family protein N-acetyltransferase
MSIIQTERCDLIPATIEFLELLVEGEYSRAGNVLGITVPHGWPNDAEAQAGLHIHLKAMRENPIELLWRIRLIVLRPARTVIGAVNLKGPPGRGGTVEIGWGVIVEFRRVGIATEASASVITWVFQQLNVQRVVATIPTHNIASAGVAKRLGMQLTEETRRGLPVWELNRPEGDVITPTGA